MLKNSEDFYMRIYAPLFFHSDRTGFIEMEFLF